MKKIFIFLLSLLQAGIFWGQVPDTVTLDYCYVQAEKNWPLAQQKDLLNNSSDLKISNLNKNWLPTLNLNGSGTLQSDVTQLSVSPVPGVIFQSPEISKDWYKLTFDVNQSVYDGNITSYQKKLENFNLRIDQKNVQVNLYAIKERINQVYFSIFLIRQSEDILRTNLSLLDTTFKEVQSGVENGVQLATNADALHAEIIRTEQQMAELQSEMTTAFRILSDLVSVTIPESSHLVLPETRLTSLAYENKRPEYELFDIQQGRVGLMRNMVTTKWNPKLYAFGQLGYGRPGFNLLSNDFTTFWIFGAKLSWNFFNWNQNRNEKKILDIQKEIIRTQKETFDKNTRVSADKESGDILKISGILQQDEEIIALRKRITKTASVQLDNGVITSSDFITRLNEETRARFSFELHKIQLAQAKLAFLYTLGKL